jgi:hypothetical protein
VLQYQIYVSNTYNRLANGNTSWLSQLRKPFEAAFLGLDHCLSPTKRLIRECEVHESGGLFDLRPTAVTPHIA